MKISEILDKSITLFQNQIDSYPLFKTDFGTEGISKDKLEEIVSALKTLRSSIEVSLENKEMNDMEAINTINRIYNSNIS